MVKHLTVREEYDKLYGIVLERNGDNGLKVTIRPINTWCGYLKQLHPDRYDGGPSYWSNAHTIYERQFISVQVAVNELFIDYLIRNGKSKGDVVRVNEVVTHPIPYPRYLKTTLIGQCFLLLKNYNICNYLYSIQQEV